MSTTDFVDKDLIQRRDSVKEVKMGPGGPGQESKDVSASDEAPVQSISDLNITHLAKRKEMFNSQVATAMDEIERLRRRQESLEREKNALETLRANQEKYESGKREMIDHLDQSLVTLEREEVLLGQKVELLADSQKRFRDMLAELRRINEAGWSEDTVVFREELAKALTVIDDMRKEYKKALARIEALKDLKGPGTNGQAASFDGFASDQPHRRGFADWLQIGFAFSLPLLIILLVLITVIIIRGGPW